MEDSKRAEFEAKLKALYGEYLEHCREVGISHPADFVIFTQRVMEAIAKEKAHKIAEADTKDMDPEEQPLYITTRVADVPNPAGGAAMRSCAQCGESVWIDPTMAKYIDMSQAIICTHCVPEITGRSAQDIVDEKTK